MQQASPGRLHTLRRGTLAAFAAYGMWGLFPLYWKQLKGVPAGEVLCHRVLWSGVLLLGVLLLQRRFKSLGEIFRTPRALRAVLLCALLISVNWGIYIWAVQVGRVAEASLGYYITPLLSVALGALLFHERMDGWTRVAVGLAALGVAVAAWRMGRLPWVALVLATSFAVYGALKKRAGLDALAGLAAETALAMPVALAFVVFWRGGALATGTPQEVALLVLGGPVTAIPLLVFAYAALRIPLQRLGFIQYLSPTLQLLLGVWVLGERLSGPMAFAFGVVVVAVLLYVATRAKRVSC